MNVAMSSIAEVQQRLDSAQKALKALHDSKRWNKRAIQLAVLERTTNRFIGYREQAYRIEQDYRREFLFQHNYRASKDWEAEYSADFMKAMEEVVGWRYIDREALGLMRRSFNGYRGTMSLIENDALRNDAKYQKLKQKTQTYQQKIYTLQDKERALLEPETHLMAEIGSCERLLAKLQRQEVKATSRPSTDVTRARNKLRKISKGELKLPSWFIEKTT